MTFPTCRNDLQLAFTYEPTQEESNTALASLQHHLASKSYSITHADEALPWPDIQRNSAAMGRILSSKLSMPGPLRRSNSDTDTLGSAPSLGAVVSTAVLAQMSALIDSSYPTEHQPLEPSPVTASSNLAPQADYSGGWEVLEALQNTSPSVTRRQAWLLESWLHQQLEEIALMSVDPSATLARTANRPARPRPGTSNTTASRSRHGSPTAASSPTSAFSDAGRYGDRQFTGASRSLTSPTRESQLGRPPSQSTVQSSTDTKQLDGLPLAGNLGATASSSMPRAVSSQPSSASGAPPSRQLRVALPMSSPMSRQESHHNTMQRLSQVNSDFSFKVQLLLCCPSMPQQIVCDCIPSSTRSD